MQGDLSSPEGHSVNDGISKELASVAYVSVILSSGRGTLMAKRDIMQAYRNIPVHPQDEFVLGMHDVAGYGVYGHQASFVLSLDRRRCYSRSLQLLMLCSRCYTISVTLFCWVGWSRGSALKRPPLWT